VVGAAIPAAATAAPPGPASSWRLLFQDGFNDRTLDTNKWATRYARGGDMANSNIPNGELQWYKRRNVVEGGGVLRLIAKRERTVSPNTGQVFNYSSGMITSKPSLNFRYGYLEARVKYPKGSGFWPAFWTYPSDSRFNSPEIDVAEYFGDNPSNLFLVYHRQAGGASERIIRARDWSANFHTIGVRWGPNSLTWFVDGVKRWTVYERTDRAAYLIANLAIASSKIAPPPNSSTPFPSSYKIDHIKVWKRR
jgi:beta-glucanase (GH16 family)